MFPEHRDRNSDIYALTSDYTFTNLSSYLKSSSASSGPLKRNPFLQFNDVVMSATEAIPVLSGSGSYNDQLILNKM